MMRWAALAVVLGACAERARVPALPASPLPPLVAWLEPGRDARELVLVVLPTRAGVAVNGDIAVAIRGAHERHIRMQPGRTRFALAPGETRVHVTASWSDGRAGARIELEHPPVTVTPPRFVPIVELRHGRDGPSVDQAVRIR